MKWSRTVYRPKPITIATITFIPFLDGFWAESFDVLKLCLESILAHTRPEYDLLVFDNGSCAEVQAYLQSLQQAGKIQYLLLSHNNLGKVGAWNAVFAAAPGEIIAYMDSDVYFLPGWLDDSIAVLNAFPKVGMVTAHPVIGGDRSRRLETREAKEDEQISIEYGEIIPEAFLTAQLVGINATVEEQARRRRGRKDVVLTRNGVSASVNGSHFQFTTRKEVVSNIVPLPIVKPLDAKPFDQALVELGYWRLSTTDYLVHHMGNRVPDLAEEMPWVDQSLFDKTVSETIVTNTKQDSDGGANVSARLLQSPTVRRLLKRINVVTHNLLSRS